ncbi:hypothetical protein IFM89_038742 [Coptis chinensis]|uniref:DUF4283 domain-containing protein n=1 Tax=Coptis chinensis TaxID=261450 RepID=A0A835HJL1_9MAGN|nr:hypothetical protein IFM89_038742 [Coptis chinensis]
MANLPFSIDGGRNQLNYGSNNRASSSATGEKDNNASIETLNQGVTTNEVQDKKSYAAAARPKYGRNVDLVALLIPGEQGEFPTIALIDDELEKGLEFYKFALVGRLDLKMINLEEVRRIASTLWKPKAKQTLGFYVSVRVDVDLSKKIPDKIWVESKKFSVAFWQEEQPGKIPDFCNHCKGVGHLVGSCRLLKTDLAQSKKTSDGNAAKGKEIMVEQAAMMDELSKSRGEGFEEKELRIKTVCYNCTTLGLC